MPVQDLAIEAADPAIRTDLSGILQIADGLSRAGRLPEALALLDALEAADRERDEVRFARAVLLIDLGRAAEAEPILADLVASQPDITRLRLEHGRALAALGRTGTATRQLRRALADNPPAGVVSTVQAALAAMQSRQRVFGSFGFGLAPDSNINAATSAESIDLYGLPFTLDPDARARSGIGVLGNIGLGWRQPVARNVASVIRVNGFGRIYPDAPNDDLSVELRAGLELGRQRTLVTPEVTWLRRWYAGSGYASAIGGALRLDQAVNPRWQVSAVADVRRIWHDRNTALDGWAGSLRLESNHSLSAGTFLVLAATGSRIDSRDPGQSYWLTEADLALYRDWPGGWSTGLGLTLGHLAGDAPQLPITKARDDRRWRGSLSLANRKIAVLGLVPGLRLVHEGASSPLPLYRYSRTRAELTVDRRF